MPGDALRRLLRELGCAADGDGEAGRACCAAALVLAEPQPTLDGVWLRAAPAPPPPAPPEAARAPKPNPPPFAALIPTPQPSTPGWLPGMEPKATPCAKEGPGDEGACEGDERRCGWEKGEEGKVCTGCWYEACVYCIVHSLPAWRSVRRGRAAER